MGLFSKKVDGCIVFVGKTADYVPKDKQADYYDHDNYFKKFYDLRAGQLVNMYYGNMLYNVYSIQAKTYTMNQIREAERIGNKGASSGNPILSSINNFLVLLYSQDMKHCELKFHYEDAEPYKGLFAVLVKIRYVPAKR